MRAQCRHGYGVKCVISIGETKAYPAQHGLFALIDVVGSSVRPNLHIA